MSMNVIAFLVSTEEFAKITQVDKTVRAHMDTLAHIAKVNNDLLYIALSLSSTNYYEKDWYLTGIAPRIFRCGADSSDEGAKIWFSGYYKMPKISEEIAFHLPEVVIPS